MRLFESFRAQQSGVEPFGSAHPSAPLTLRLRSPFGSAQGEDNLHAEPRRGTPLLATPWPSGRNDKGANLNYTN